MIGVRGRMELVPAGEGLDAGDGPCLGSGWRTLWKGPGEA